MFATVIVDAYEKKDARKIADALEDLCHPQCTDGWASAGVYSYWDYYTNEILYIGLAVDLAQRFKQHNGIIPARSNTCKKEQIKEYFNKKNKLGYTVFVQSPLSQPQTAKNEELWGRFYTMCGMENLNDKSDRENIKILEGVLIEVYENNHGVKPPWNKIRGSKEGRAIAQSNCYELIRCINGKNGSNLIAKSTLREIENNLSYQRFEEFLHAARIFQFNFGHDLIDAIKMIISRDNILGQSTYDDIVESNYLNKQLFTQQGMLK